MIVGATFTGPEVADFLHAATIAVVGEVPLERLFHAVPAFPTRSEVWLYLLEALGIAGPCGGPPRARMPGMDVVVAGGHGKVGLRLLRLLADRGHRARGLIRNPDHARDLEEVGAEAVVCDIEALDDISECCAGRRRGGVRRRRGAGQRAGAQADGGLRRRRQADRGREEERDRPLRDRQRDQRGPPRGVV